MTQSQDRLARALMIITVMCTVLLTGMVVRRELFSAGQRRKSTSPRKVEPWPDIARVGHFFGSTRARNQVLVFSDFQCPYCRRFALETMPALERKYGSQVAIVFRHWPLENHRWAYPAARAAECAGEQGRFRELHDYIFAHQEQIGASFVEAANAVGLDDRVFKECFARPAPVANIDRDVAAARQLKGDGTPLVIVNGMLLVADRDSLAISRMIAKTTVDR